MIGCKDKTSDTPQPEIAVANSYIGAALRDLCGNQQQVFDLVPPGMCPGHFDISPSQVNTLCNCKILFVFDFQKNIEKAIPRIRERGLKVCKITPSPGMCIPETYLSIVKQTADVLSQQYPLKENKFVSRVNEIEKRLQNLSQDITDRVKKSGLLDTKVITSQHQAEFVKWLGLDCVSAFAGRDTITPAQIDQNLREAKQNQIQFIIANKQEGTEMAETIAEYLKVKYVVFSNFPGIDRPKASIPEYDYLVVENVNRLIEAIQ